MQPTPFARSTSFTEFQAASPTSPLPGYELDVELNNISLTLEQTLFNLALIQRDDGQLRNDIVTVDAIDDAVLEAIAAAIVIHSAGEDGEDGEDAQNPIFSVQATTLAPGAPATAAITGAYPNLLINLGIPKGDPSVGGATLEDGDYGDVDVSAGGSAMQVTGVGGQVPSFPGHGHATADIAGLDAALAAILSEDDLTWENIDAKPETFPAEAHNHDDLYYTEAEIDALLAAKQAAGAYATTGQLAAKADAITSVQNRSTNQNVSDASHNGVYNRMTGASTRTITFGGTPSAGHCSFWVNRGTASMTVICGGGYYKNGAAKATANFSLPVNGELSAFHEGGGEWKFTVS